MKIINFQMEKMKSITKKKQKNGRNYIKMQKYVIFIKKYLKINMLKIKKIYLRKSGTIVIIQVNIEVLHIVYST